MCAVGAIHGLKAACSGERVRTPEPQLPTELNVAVPLMPGGNVVPDGKIFRNLIKVLLA